jgi:hypothetical protein
VLRRVTLPEQLTEPFDRDDLAVLEQEYGEQAPFAATGDGQETSLSFDLYWA